MQLQIEEITDLGAHEVALLEGRVCRVGRDLMSDIPLASTALSRLHGQFSPFPSGWVYKDLGSTNGSWLNGERLASHLHIGLKNGDFLQVADTILRVKYKTTWEGSRSARLLVFREEMPFREMVLAEEGGVLSFGGADCNLAIDGAISGEIICEFFQVGEQVEFDLHDASFRVLRNSEPVVGRIPVKIGDNFVFGEYQILVVDGALAPVQGHVYSNAGVSRVASGVDLTSVPQTEREQEPQVFSPTHTVAVQLKPGAFSKFGERPVESDDDDNDSQSAGLTPIESFLEALKAFFDFEGMTDVERRLVVGIIFFLASSLILFLIWLLFL